jgi:hypothetical protein
VFVFTVAAVDVAVAAVEVTSALAAAISVASPVAAIASVDVDLTPKRPIPENVTSAAATDAVATSAVVAKRISFCTVLRYNESLLGAKRSRQSTRSKHVD